MEIVSEVRPDSGVIDSGANGWFPKCTNKGRALVYIDNVCRFEIR